LGACYGFSWGFKGKFRQSARIAVAIGGVLLIASRIFRARLEDPAVVMFLIGLPCLSYGLLWFGGSWVRFKSTEDSSPGRRWRSKGVSPAVFGLLVLGLALAWTISSRLK
jgi:hypothetical protein